MQIVAASGERSDQQSLAFAKGMLHRGGVPIGILTRDLSSLGLIFLQEIAAENFVALHLERQLVEQVRREFHVALGGAEDLVESQIGLRSPGVPVIAEVSRKPLA